MNRKFGVELEFISNITVERVEHAVHSVGERIRTARSMARRRPYWHYKYDSSVSSGHYGSGRELASPILKGETGIRRLSKVTQAIFEAWKAVRLGKLTNQSCGLHVHVDVSDLTHEQMIRFVTVYLKAQPVVYQMISPYRATRWYCTPVQVTGSDWEVRLNRHGGTIPGRVREACFSSFHEKYRGLSFRNYEGNGTVEFRMHEGTMNSARVESWVRFILALVGLAKRKSSARERHCWTEHRLFSLIGWTSKSACPEIKKAMIFLRKRISSWRKSNARRRSYRQMNPFRYFSTPMT